NRTRPLSSSAAATLKTPSFLLLPWVFSPSPQPRPLPSAQSEFVGAPAAPPAPCTYFLPTVIFGFVLFYFFTVFCGFFFLAFFSFLVNLAAREQPDCLTKIERITFYPTHGCTSLAEEIFAIGTNATLTLQCPGYSGMQINNTQAKKKRKKREVTTNKCRERVAYLIGLWRRFSRIS
uniref:Thymic stromal lymphopoietin n=2 Tax=Ursus TaxID=9639 RepID=A0A452UK32_URSMA